MIRTHHDLEVWQKAMDMVAEIYRLTAQFPPEEKFGLVSQMRRAAISVPSNIAEGSAKQTGNFRRHIEDARGSLAELETQLELALRLKFVDSAQAQQLQHLLIPIGKMLTNLHRSLKE